MATESPVSPGKGGIGRTELRVIVCDDSDAVRSRIVRMTNRIPGIRVEGEAIGVASCTKLVTELHPDVAIVDISLPDGNGIEVLRDIKKTLPATIVIMLTNHANPMYRRACLADGADYFMDKYTEFEKVGLTLQEISRTDTSGEVDAARGARDTL